jgi:hypothetical protein
MITIAQPAMALNADGAPGPQYLMWNSWLVDSSVTPDNMMGWVAQVANGAPGGRLKALCFNSHGNNAFIKIGTGISWGDVASFGAISGLVDEIYINGCQVVSFTGPGDGNLFCGAIAKAAQAYVYASNVDQDPGLHFSYPYGQIDGFEGNVWKWHPDGSNELTNL